MQRSTRADADRHRLDLPHEIDAEVEWPGESMVLRVGRAVVFALAKQLNKEWDTDAVKHALAPESLSLAADDFYDSLQNARPSMGRQFPPNRQSDEPEVPDEKLISAAGAWQVKMFFFCFSRF